MNPVCITSRVDLPQHSFKLTLLTLSSLGQGLAAALGPTADLHTLNPVHSNFLDSDVQKDIKAEQSMLHSIACSSQLWREWRQVSAHAQPTGIRQTRRASQ